MKDPEFDVAVVGGGHAGCEAALAAARLGARTVLVTMNQAKVACMPCNPSIGGLAKSHLIWEVDALGGEIGRNADYTGIQFRTLNTSRGPAVRATRVQCDKEAYSRRMAAVLASTPGLEVLEAEVSEIWTEYGALQGVILSDESRVACRAVVVTAGTSLHGRLHIGFDSSPGGGTGERAADPLGNSLSALGLSMARLKTGTPPRLDRDSIAYCRMEAQPGFEPAPMFSWAARRERRMFHVEHPQVGEADPGTMFHVEHHGDALCPWIPGLDQIPCYLTHTTPVTHSIIQSNLSRSALYGGAILGTGVRYCPSVEDKVVKFPDKDGHHVFIEPEGRTSRLIYPNGISNSLPKSVQVDLVHSIPGLEQAHIVDWAYAIEYDFSDPTQLLHSLECKGVENLFLAGQVNGTTGYEEAAAQGFMAGVNAVRKVRGVPPLIIARHEGYIGVLIDDLVTKGTDEPYRMFTSRAERRLLLRQDNARFRMLPFARELGILPDVCLEETERFGRQTEAEIERLRSLRDGPRSLDAVLRRPGVRYADLPSADTSLPTEVAEQVEIRLKYQGYIEHEERLVEDALKLEGRVIPEDFEYASVVSLKYEAREKLERIRPRTLGQASRIPGINPPDVAILSVLLKRGSSAE